MYCGIFFIIILEIYSLRLNLWFVVIVFFYGGCVDIFEVVILEGEIMVLKLYRLGCIFFWVVKLKWDYLKYCNSYSWLYLLRLVVFKEYVFMKVRFILLVCYLVVFFFCFCCFFKRCFGVLFCFVLFYYFW